MVVMAVFTYTNKKAQGAGLKDPRTLPARGASIPLTTFNTEPTSAISEQSASWASLQPLRQVII